MVSKPSRTKFMKRLAMAALVASTISVSSALRPATALGAMAQTTSSVNFRVGPSTNYSVIQKLVAGTAIDVLSHGQTWSKVELSGTTGYLSTRYIDFTSTGYITGRVNLRSRGSSKGTSLLKIPSGSTVTVLSGPVNGWYKVRWNDLTGYIYKNYVMVEEMTVGLLPGPETPAGIAPVGALPAETGAAFTLTGPAQKYLTAADAIAKTNASGIYPAGRYYIYKTALGMINVSPIYGEAGAWIDPTGGLTGPSGAQSVSSLEGYTRITWNVSFYTTLPQENGGYNTTALGTGLRYGVLSSNYWPLGSQVVLPGWGSFTVEDRGSASFDSKYRLDMVIPRNPGESDARYLDRIHQMGVQTIPGYVKPAGQ